MKCKTCDGRAAVEFHNEQADLTVAACLACAYTLAGRMNAVMWLARDIASPIYSSWSSSRSRRIWPEPVTRTR
jgi:hypothetical protein